MEQKIITARGDYIEFDQWIHDNGCKKLLMVCDDSLKFMDNFNRHLAQLEKNGLNIIRFSDFQPNPLYESVVEGVKLLRAESCDSIMAVGGGSAMDVAKCIKLYSNMEGNGDDGSYLKHEKIPDFIPEQVQRLPAMQSFIITMQSRA